MADFEINKGVGREVEFKGLRAQYLFIFAAGLLAVFVMFVIMIIMCFHLYLANIEGIAPTLLILFRKEHGGLVYDPVKRNVVGYDAMGHGESKGEGPSKLDLDKEGVKC